MHMTASPMFYCCTLSTFDFHVAIMTLSSYKHCNLGIVFGAKLVGDMDFLLFAH